MRPGAGTIEAAELARAKASHPELFEAKAKLKALRSLSTVEKARHLASGRGIALVRR